MSQLAPPPGQAGPSLTLLTGAQRAAAVMMLLGESDGKAIWSELNDQEVKQLCLAMSELGSVKGEAIADLVEEFVGEFGEGGPVRGSLDRAQELLSSALSPERVSLIMSDLHGSSTARQVWRRLGQVPPRALATFLGNEHPQVVAVVLSRINPDLGGEVLALLPEDIAVDVIDRLLRLGEVRPEALEPIEEMLHREFVAKGPTKVGRDTYDVMAERFDAFDRPTEARLMAALGKANRDSAQRIRERMLTFEDLLKLDSAGAQTLLRQVDKDTLGRALKGASDGAREFFLSNMSSRAAKNLQDEMEVLGQIRVKEVDEAQTRMVQVAKALAAKGEIRVPKSRADEDVVG